MRVAGFFLALGLALVAPSLADAETKTTVYTYNADGALTSITETSDGGAKTTYFTWDNFEADPSSPSIGTVTAANGNLIGMGTTPGDDSVSSWHHDVLDRLVRVTHGQRGKALYQYHPDELLAASLNADAPSTDGLQHYYDESRYPQVTNLYDRHTGELSSRHKRIRYLPDGTEQMLVRHRKDVDGVYELTGQTMSGYGYDPYGASLEQELTGSPPAGPLYSVRNNPYRYTHELQDPVSGAYYLRARWYLPGHQTFLQRDPFPNLNRYGYANGNPITNYDPSGRRTTFFKGLGTGLLAQATFGLEPAIAGIISDPKGYFKDARNDVALAMSLLDVVTMAAEALGPFVGSAVLNRFRAFQRFTVLGTLGIGLFSGVQGALVARGNPTGSAANKAGRAVGAALGVATLAVIGFAGNRALAGRAYRRDVEGLLRKVLPDQDRATIAAIAKKVEANELEGERILALRDQISAKEEALNDSSAHLDAEQVKREKANLAQLKKEDDDRTQKLFEQKNKLTDEIRRLQGRKVPPPREHSDTSTSRTGWMTNLVDHEPTASSPRLPAISEEILEELHLK